MEWISYIHWDLIYFIIRCKNDQGLENLPSSINELELSITTIDDLAGIPNQITHLGLINYHNGLQLDRCQNLKSLRYYTSSTHTPLNITALSSDVSVFTTTILRPLLQYLTVVQNLDIASAPSLPNLKHLTFKQSCERDVEVFHNAFPNLTKIINGDTELEIKDVKK